MPSCIWWSVCIYARCIWITFIAITVHIQYDLKIKSCVSFCGVFLVSEKWVMMSEISNTFVLHFVPRVRLLILEESCGTIDSCLRHAVIYTSRALMLEIPAFCLFQQRKWIRLTLQPVSCSAWFFLSPPYECPFSESSCSDLAFVSCPLSLCSPFVLFSNCVIIIS